MPWHVGHAASCPASKPWAVIKNADGSVAGCHPTKAAANQQMAVLYANEPEAASTGRRVMETRNLLPAEKSAFQAQIKKDPTVNLGAAVRRLSQWAGSGSYPTGTTYDDLLWMYNQICAELKRRDPKSDAGGNFPPKRSASWPAEVRGAEIRCKALTDILASVKARAEKGQGNSAPPGGEYRTVPFDLASAEVNGDGLTFEGYAAVFNTPTRIAGWDEDFDEQIAPGAFDRTLAAGFPKLMFEHGRHPLIGTMPLGVLTRAEPDSTGVWISGRLTDNWLIQPVRDAVRDKAVDGMSFRFTVDEGGDTWLERAGDVPLRTLLSVGCPELGPVVFPAYEPTTASVRSMLDKLPEFGRPPAGARAANGRAGDAPGKRAAPQPSLSERFRRDSESLILRGIEGVRI